MSNEQDAKKTMSIVQHNDIGSAPSFAANWFVWGILETIVISIFLVSIYTPSFNNNYAIGAIANRQEAYNYGAASFFIAAFFSFFTCWIPALIAYKMQKKTFGKKMQDKKGFEHFSHQELSDFIDKDLNSNIRIASHPWIAANWFSLSTEQKEIWVKNRRKQIDLKFKEINSLIDLVTIMQEVDKEKSREATKAA